MKLLRLPLVAAALVAAAVLAPAQSVSFSDTEFDDADWSVPVIILGVDGGSSVGTQLPAGGNPGTARSVFHSMNSGSGQPNVNHALHYKAGSDYDSALFGEIVSIDYRIDYKCLSSTGAFCRTIALGILQAGKLYTSPRVTVFANDPWRTTVHTGLLATDFSEIDPVTFVVNPFSNPDFSDAGPPLQVGFMVSGTQLATTGFSSTTSAYDNFFVDVNVCPGPALASETIANGFPPNPSVFMTGQTSRPILGQVWDPLIDHTSFFTSAVWDFVFVSPTPPVNLPVPPFGTFLCDIPPPTLIFFAPAGTPFSIPIPDVCVLSGVSACSQGGSLAPGPSGGLQIALTNGIDLVFGTF